MITLIVHALCLAARRCLPRPTVSGGLLALATLLLPRSTITSASAPLEQSPWPQAQGHCSREAKKLSARPRRRGDPRESGTLPMPRACNTPMISANPFMS